MKKLTNKGYTIIELLIASLVFTTILLLCLEGITRLGKLYVKNISTSRTNQFIKSLSDEVTNQIKFGASKPEIISTNTDNSYRFCISNKAYKIVFNTRNDSVLRKVSNGCSSIEFSDSNFFVTNSENLGPPGMRVLDFSINQPDPGNSLWFMNIKVALGDNDLLIDSDGNELNDTTPYEKYKEARCRSGISGGEFCSVLGISSSAMRRLE